MCRYVSSFNCHKILNEENRLSHFFGISSTEWYSLNDTKYLSDTRLYPYFKVKRGRRLLEVYKAKINS